LKVEKIAIHIVAEQFFDESLGVSRFSDTIRSNQKKKLNSCSGLDSVFDIGFKRVNGFVISVEHFMKISDVNSPMHQRGFCVDNPSALRAPPLTGREKQGTSHFLLPCQGEREEDELERSGSEDDGRGGCIQPLLYLSCQPFQPFYLFLHFLSESLTYLHWSIFILFNIVDENSTNRYPYHSRSCPRRKYPFDESQRRRNLNGNWRFCWMRRRK
jgi:hypothetical protein